MPHTLYLAPCGAKVGLTSVALGLVRALDNRGVRIGFCKPIGQPAAHTTGPERSTHFIRATTNLQPPRPISLEEAERLISTDRTDELMERVMRDFHESSADADVVVVEGLAHSSAMPFGATLNVRLVKTLSAQVILTGSLAGISMPEFDEKLEVAASQYGGLDSGAIIGCIINHVANAQQLSLSALREALAAQSRLLERDGFHLIGAIPQNAELTACRTIDIARHLGAKVLHEGEIQTRRAKKISVLARTVPNMLHTLQAGSILVTPSDRSDVMVAIALSALKTPMAGLVLTGDFPLDERVWNLCKIGFETGLPVLSVESNSWETATHLHQLDPEVPEDDLERVQLGMDHVALYIDADWIASHAAIPVETRMSP
ncbi:MAG TPA: DRTGG domain-containing protein, partial [Terrimicrobiaceae bacterium]